MENQPRCAIILRHGKKQRMKKRPQIIVYILLNIIISAATILFVMWMWDRSNQKPILVDESAASMTPAIETSGSPQSDPENGIAPDPPSELISGGYDIEIETIVGPGNLEVEYVEISNEGQNAVDMTDWRLTDEDGQIYSFPTIILNQGGEIKVLSQEGIDTVIELYWQSDTPIWESGETARLLDKNGTIISTYSIP